MNKHEHADTSARLFGGKSKEYEKFHSLIDSNKLVTPSIFGRFFLHHIDVGLPIAERVLGTHIGTLKVPTRSLFIQHLLEDYGCVPTFEKDWCGSFKNNIPKLIKLNEWNEFKKRASQDVRLKSFDENKLRILDSLFSLKGIVPESFSVEQPIMYAIFGHALGADLLAKVINREFLFKNVYTLDALIGYLNCRFNSFKYADPVPNLIDWEKYVEDQSWMHAPKRTTKEETYYEDLYQAINEYNPKDEKYSVAFRLAKERKETIRELVNAAQRQSEMFRREPCNYD